LFETFLATKLDLEFPFMLVAEHIASKIKSEGLTCA